MCAEQLIAHKAPQCQRIPNSHAMQRSAPTPSPVEFLCILHRVQALMSLNDPQRWPPRYARRTTLLVAPDAAACPLPRTYLLSQ